MEEQFLKEYYASYDEDGRLLSRCGQVEYLTTMRYLHRYLKPGMAVLEIGAGTGRYSLALAREGYDVTAVELIESNLIQLRQGIREGDRITALQGNALDLSALQSGSFDMTLVLGPMYHLYTEEDKRRAMSEALRVTKPGGMVFVAYCMNEPTMIQYCFQKGMIRPCLEKHMLTEEYHCLSQPQDLFELVRVEDIDRLNEPFPVERLALIATDGATRYMEDTVNAMDDETFRIYLDYHFHICERGDLIGASNHVLDILKKAR